MTIQSLTQLQVGQQAQISEIRSLRESRLNSLSVFGIVPGSLITLRQRRSAYIVTVDQTDVAIDPEIACEIMVCAT